MANEVGLPVILDDAALGYGCLTVRQHDNGELEALGDVPDRCMFSSTLLDEGIPGIEWDGKRRITVTLANGSWSWDAEAQDPSGRIIYAGPTR